MYFEWILTTYVSKERGKKKSSGMGQENHDQVLQDDEVSVEGETSLTSKVVEDREKTSYANSLLLL